MVTDPLETPVQYVKAVGPDRAELLARLQIDTVRDLLWHLPRDVLDLTQVVPVHQINGEDVQTVRGVVVDVDGRRISRGRTLVAVLLAAEGGYVRGVWFNQPWMLRKFVNGQTVLFSGKPKRHAARWEFPHPHVQWLEEDDRDSHGGMLPRYGLTEGIRMHVMRRCVRAALDGYLDAVSDDLPESFCKENRLLELPAALSAVHRPDDRAEFAAGLRRLLFDDLFEFQLGLALRRRAWQKADQAPRLPTTAKIDARIRRLFPFRFTPGQDEAVAEIAHDLDRPAAMHRLLQADVGAGKTAVAIYAMLVAIAAGYQAVLMAPTELLARQHWATIEEALAHSRVVRLLLTGDLTPDARREALQAVRSGDVQLIVGTQAVIQRDVEFAKLGLVVIDEQHKFGVMQRARFNQGPTSPHMLVMTATPIPRSLCLTQFGDLDITTISDMPPQRQRVTTSVIHGEAPRAKMWEFIRKQLRAGRQAFVVCPRIEETAAAEDGAFPIAAEQVFERLSKNELSGVRSALVHGRMSGDEKDRLMSAFREGDTQVLVSTTVVEVGVDVPNATVMVVVGAERFGLSQLHQLRGRIGRGVHPGFCFLLTDSGSQDVLDRIKALERYADGFHVAEADFEHRGPGDVLGTRQHGDLPLKVADLTRDQALLEEAREAAFQLVASGRFDEPQFAKLMRKVLRRFGQTMDLAKSG